MVVLKMKGAFVIGTLLQNVRDFAGNDDRAGVNQFLMQPFINYNFPDTPWPLPELFAGHHRGLEAQRARHLDGTARRADRSDHQMGQATDQPVGGRVLQHCEARVRRGLDAATTSGVPVPEREIADHWHTDVRRAVAHVA